MQAVFGEGSARAKVMFVGEQPGDREDREGHPFVGPAGHVFDRTLEEAGIDRKQTYVPTRSSTSATRNAASAASISARAPCTSAPAAPGSDA